MRRGFLPLSIAIAFAGLLFAGGAPASDLRTKVETAYDAFDAAFNAADPGAIADRFADGARVHAPGGAAKTGDEIPARYAGLFEAGVTDHNLELIDAYERGDLVIAIGRWSAKKPNGDGGMTELGGNALQVYERQSDGSLKIRELIFN